MNSNNNLKLKTPLLFGLTLAIGMFLGTRLQKNLQPRTNAPKNKMEELLELVKKNYVDDINSDSLLQNINATTNKAIDSLETKRINAFLEKLDPHSVYIPPTLLQQSNEEMKGEFAGVGIEYNIMNDTVFTNYVVPNGPADNAQLKVGDQLIKIEDSIIAGNKITPFRLRKMLRGADKSKVTITFLRDNQPKSVTITRGIVALPSIDASYMINSNTGFIKLNKFSLNSYDEFKIALQKLKEQGMSQLIFDLRGNGGGILGDAVDIVDEFVSGKELVTYTEGVHLKRQNYYTTKNGLFETGKLVVLIDEFSASASEVVAGALQDLDRATIIGRRSFGKGLVQRQFGFADNSAVRLTVARYYTPIGRSIQKPYNKGKNAYENDIENRIQSKSLMNADSNKLITTTIFKTKKGNIVYGGGGITPNVFVALDTSSQFFEALRKLYENNTFNNYSFYFLKNNKTLIASYKDANSFAKEFAISENLWQSFIQFAKKDSIDLSKASANQKKIIEERTKEFIARQIWRNNGLYEVINQKDKVVEKAMLFLKN